MLLGLALLCPEWLRVLPRKVAEFWSPWVPLSCAALCVWEASSGAVQRARNPKELARRAAASLVIPLASLSTAALCFYGLDLGHTVQATSAGTAG